MTAMQRMRVVLAEDTVLLRQGLVALLGEHPSVAEVVEAGDLEQLTRGPGYGGRPTNLRWVLVHMVEEYARHAGHADLIRQSIDGATDV